MFFLNKPKETALSILRDTRPPARPQVSPGLSEDYKVAIVRELFDAIERKDEAAFLMVFRSLLDCIERN